MKPYVLKKIRDKEYSALIIGIAHESPLSYLETLEDELKNNDIEGNILIDCLLHNGNSKDRFIKIYFDDIFDMTSAVIVDLARDNFLRQYSSRVLSEYPEIVANSILNKFQKNLLNNKISL